MSSRTNPTKPSLREATIQILARAVEESIPLNKHTYVAIDFGEKADLIISTLIKEIRGKMPELRVIGDYNDGGDPNYRNRRDAVDRAYNEPIRRIESILNEMGSWDGVQ